MIHLYTGNGKGKTTAAFGLAIRCAMTGKKVWIGQFVKDMAYSETKITEFVDLIKIEQLGQGCFIDRPPQEEDKIKASSALEKCGNILQLGEYDMVILDEITIAIYFGLLSEASVIQAINGKADHVEVILTGRYATEGFYEIADLVTEMTEIKHYYTEKGLLSRKGIDC